MRDPTRENPKIEMLFHVCGTCTLHGADERASASLVWCHGTVRVHARREEATFACQKSGMYGVRPKVSPCARTAAHAQP